MELEFNATIYLHTSIEKSEFPLYMHAYDLRGTLWLHGKDVVIYCSNNCDYNKWLPKLSFIISQITITGSLSKKFWEWFNRNGVCCTISLQYGEL